MRARRTRWLLVSLLLSSACATAPPVLTGGSTTPHRRGDVLLGGAARVPFGALREPAVPVASDGRYGRDAQAAGIVPVAAARYGVARDVDVGLVVAGSTARVELRREHVLAEGTTRPSFVYALGPYVGVVDGGDSLGGRATRMGLDLPLTYAIDFGGVYEFWLGARLAAELVRGRLARDGALEDVRAGKVSGGALLGLALGFRRLHVLLELTAAYERWWGDHGGRSVNRSGLVLTPAFALRLRI